MTETFLRVRRWGGFFGSPNTITCRLGTVVVAVWFAVLMVGPPAAAKGGDAADPPSAAAPSDAAPLRLPFPTPPTKKGLQVQMVDDALALGIDHAAVNISMGRMLRQRSPSDAISFTWAGKEWQLNGRYVRSLDRQIKPLSDAGVVVYAILLAYPTGDSTIDGKLLHPAATGDYTIAGFNTTSQEGLDTFRTLVAFLAQRYNRPDQHHGRIWGWIIGNEVNSQKMWYNLGEMPLAEAVSEYEKAVRAAHESVQAFSSNARCYLSFDHHWTASMPGAGDGFAYPARDFLSTFAQTARQRGDFAWHVALHPYPDDLGNPRTWLDEKAWPNEDAPHVTFKNLDVACRFLGQPELRWQGEPRSVILSEQGIHCLDTPDGEPLQAAGFAYAWEQVKDRDCIDAMIWHRHVDHAHEGGLRLGLWENKPGTVSTPHRKRPIYHLFRKAGTPQWREAADFALPIIGIPSWDAL